MNGYRFLLFFGAMFFAACGFGGGSASNRTPERVNSTPPVKANANIVASPEINAKAASVPVPTTKAECLSVDTGDNVVFKSQTFAVDFEPFKGSCFVTAHNPEYDDPPLESEMAIYRDGKKIFTFPSQFNGVTFGCWVEAVSFQDLNADSLTDIIVVGKCSAKSAPYNENMVYVNTGKSFTTKEDGNYRLADLGKVKEIADFVKENKQIFFK